MNQVVPVIHPADPAASATRPAAQADPLHGHPTYDVVEDISVADYLVASIDREDVDAVFGIPGGNLAPILQSLRRHERLRFIIASHEGGAAFMADGYARATGKLGVCLLTAGPGVLNAINGIASAHLDQVPMLVVSGQVVTERFGLGAIQESTAEGGINVVELVRHAAGASTGIVDAASFPRLLGRALRVAQAAPGGVAHLSVPANVARRKIARGQIPAARGAYGSALPAPAAADVRAVYEMLERSRRPLLFLGSGARAALAGGGEDLRAFVRALGVPVATSMGAKGLFAEDDPMSLGVLGMAGSARSEAYVREGCDALVVLGCRMDEWATRSFSSAFDRVGAVAQVDLRAERIGSFLSPRLSVVGDVGAVLRGLYDHARRPGAVDERRACTRSAMALAAAAGAPAAPLPAAGPLKPQHVFHDLDAALRGDMDLYIDMGNGTAWATNTLRIVPPTRIFYPCGLSSMGWSCGAVVGGKLGRPDRVAVAITGDGSFVMNGNEVRTAARYRIGAVTVVLNDDYLGMVNHGMLPVENGYSLDDDYYSMGGPDLAGFARSLGADAYDVHRPGQMAGVFAEAVARADSDRRPQVIVAHIDHHEPPPYGDRFRAVHDHGGAR
jgi:acetolactate synthase-1/2/3 large subunit